MCVRCERLALAVLADRLRGEPDRLQPDVAEGHEVDMAVSRGQSCRDIAFLVDHAPAMLVAKDRAEFDQVSERFVQEMGSYLAGLDAERIHRAVSWIDWMREALSFAHRFAVEALAQMARDGDEYAKRQILAAIQAGVMDPSFAEGIPGVEVRRVAPGSLAGRPRVQRVRPEDLQ